MNILINLATLKKGGGQNVGLNFLHSLESLALKNENFHFFVAEGSAAYKFLLERQSEDYTVLSKNPIKRIIFELFSSKKILIDKKIDIIYTYFGIGMFTKKIPQISGSADSNLYFPEIDFWSHYKGIPRLKKWIVDSYRIWGLKRADAVIFENKIMEERSKELFGLKETTFIMPSINIELKSNNCTLLKMNDRPKGLFLCGWQLNKNIMLIPEIASHLKKSKTPFQFILTAPKDKSVEHIRFIKLVELHNVKEYIEIIGPVKKEELPSLYQKINFVFLLSKLESFSNNIIESWFHRRLLFISDELWAKSICKEAALFVDRDNAMYIATHIKRIIKDEVLKNKIIEKASKEILNYPSINERTIAELNYIKKVYETN
jgi:glycosyltransferase involved in cell wall biosynthesis